MRAILIFILLHMFEKINCSSTVEQATVVETPSAALPVPSATIATTATAEIQHNTTTASSTTKTSTTEKLPEKKPKLSLISSIPTFDFSKKEEEKPPKVVDTCNKQDVCIKGLCMHGTCMTKPCSTEITCICDQGFTGQFCDKNLTEVELATTITAEGLTTTTDPSVKDKHHVNGNIDHNLAKTDKGIQTSGNESSGIGNVTDPNSNGNLNVSETTKGLGNGNVNVAKVDTVNKDKAAEKSNKPAGTNLQSTDANAVQKDNSVKPSNKSYVKGPEAFVASEESTMQFKANVREIKENTPSVIREKADVITISTTAVRYSQAVEVPKVENVVPETLPKSVDKPVVKRTKGSKKEIVNNESSAKLSSPERTISNSVSEVQSGIVTNTMKKDNSVIKNPGAENAPTETLTIETVGLPSETIDLAPLLENSEIKITIETAGQDPTLNLNISDQAGTQTQEAVNVTDNSQANDALGTPGKLLVNSPSTTAPGKESHTIKLTTGSKQEKNNKVSKQESTQTADTPKQGQTTKSEVLNPLLQLMNMFGSEKFVENVSAVKIEIITKKNNTYLSESKQSGSKASQTSNVDSKQSTKNNGKNTSNKNKSGSN